MTRVKICGNRELPSAVVAAQDGADFVGFVFVPGSRRRLEAGHERDVVETFWKARAGKRPRIVGLFADQPLDEVNRWVRECHLEAVQLCGKESLDYCASVRVPVVKVLHVRDRGPRERTIEALDAEMARLDKEGIAVLLDRQEHGIFGGTGKPFDWTIAQELSSRGHQFFLAGGLNPENVAEAVRTVQPWGVDVSSGVESNGAKDAAKIAAFIREVKEGEREGRVDRLQTALSRLYEGPNGG